jgi:hypothetical protein
MHSHGTVYSFSKTLTLLPTRAESAIKAIVPQGLEVFRGVCG